MVDWSGMMNRSSRMERSCMMDGGSMLNRSSMMNRSKRVDNGMMSIMRCNRYGFSILVQLWFWVIRIL